MKDSVFQKIFNSEVHLLSIGDVASALDISTRQLRYWEQKGYIESKLSKAGQRKYTYSTLFKANYIVEYLKEGYTLAMAAQKAETHRQNMRNLHRFLQSRLNRGYKVDDGYEIDLGEIEGVDAATHLKIDLKDKGKTYFKLGPASNN